jgi:hypothetical protein
MEVLQIAAAMNILQLEKISIDGTKVAANASRHKALSCEYATKLEEQMRAEIDLLLTKAEECDHQTLPEGLDIPAEISRRKERLEKIRAAKTEIEHRAAERTAREQADYEEKITQRRAKEQETGEKAGGNDPKPPEGGPRSKDQVNLTDGDSRIMPASDGGFDQAYNAQAGVDVDTKMIVTAHVTQNANDKLEVVSTIEAIATLPGELGKVSELLGDNGYFSAANVEACVAAGITPSIAMGRDRHNNPVLARYESPPTLEENAFRLRR